MKFVVCSFALTSFATSSFAADIPKFEDIVKKVEAKFEPAKARPGQTVTLKINVELINGWHTYPLFQPDKGAKSQTNRVTFPVGGPVVFVDMTQDPPNPKEKAEPLLGIEQILYYPGGGMWERKAVIAPNATPGKLSSKIKFSLLVCDKDNCLPPKPLELEAAIDISGDAVPVDPKYKADVEKALKN